MATIFLAGRESRSGPGGEASSGRAPVRGVSPPPKLSAGSPRSVLSVRDPSSIFPKPWGSFRASSESACQCPSALCALHGVRVCEGQPCVVSPPGATEVCGSSVSS